jgi:hypothetical protein
MSSPEPKPSFKERVVTFLVRPNPYCAFTQDEWRYKAMRSRDVRLVLVTVAGAVGAYLKLH